MTFTRILFTVLLLVLSLQAHIHQQRSLQTFSFPADAHDESSFRVLVQKLNMRQISEHNLRNQNFQLGPNQFLSLTNEQFKAMFASTPQYPSPASPSDSPPQIGASVPTTTNLIIDWQASGKVSPVKNQGTICSSCYAFTATADIQTSFLIKSGKLYDLSEQQLVDCSASLGNNLCNSGFYLYSFKYIISKGINLQQNYPYTGIASNCKAKSSNSVTISSYYAYNGNSCPVLASLLQNRPVIVSIDGANTYWQFYRSGILNNCGPSNTLNHGVQVIGLYSFANGTSYYVIKNSWGSGWGEMGKMRIDRNVQNGNLCLICSYIYYSIL